MRISDWSSDVCSSDLAPLMAILMVFEMTMDATLLLPLMTGCVVAYTVSCMFRSRSSLYAVLDRRRLKQSEIREYESARLAELVRPPTKTLAPDARSEEHTSELQSLMRISYAVFCLKKKNNTNKKEN